MVDAPWRLVLPAQAQGGPSPREIEAALAPLLARRAALPALIFPSMSDMDEYEAVARWADAHAVEIDETTYFLLAGDAIAMPFALGEHLAVEKVVGRLSFRTAADYAAYAHKVVRAEERSLTRPVRPFFTFAPDWDDATSKSRRLIVEPIAAQIQRMHPEIDQIALQSEAATCRGLLRHLTGEGPDAPSLWFAACHGAEKPDPCHPDQGALGDQFGNLLRATDILGLEHPFLHDGIAILFACNGAGTPRHREWRWRFPEIRAAEPPADRTALLPEALLAHLDGPLAVVAHDDILLGYGLTDTLGNLPSSATSPGLRPFVDLVSALLEGVPVGVSLRRFRRAANEQQAWLNRQLCRRLGLTTSAVTIDDEQLVSSWMRWMDMRNWVVLGDPRVCLEGVPGRIPLAEALRAA